MPRFSEATIVSYCDFCPQPAPDTKRYSECRTCSSTMCRKHTIWIEFFYEVPAKAEVHTFLSDSVMDIVGLLSRFGYICPDCVAHGTLAEVVGRMKKI